MFDPAFDGGSWPGPLREGDAAFGQLWIGMRGLLSRLETELGLGGLYATMLERAFELKTRLETTDGFWSESLVADPIGTSRRLLADRDMLVSWGWRGEAASDRLAALWQVTGDVVGLPDRVAAVCHTIEGRVVDLHRIAMFRARDGLPTLWNQLLSALASAGAPIELVALPAVQGAGDLGRARGGTFGPVGDGSLALFRPYGPLAAADQVAASLAATESLDRVVVIGADAVFDRALARHGVPRVGAMEDAAASCALLRLCLESAFVPMDPADLHALLCLQPGPVPRAVAARLVGALASLPGRGCPEWAEALEAGLESIAEARRTSVRRRLESLLMPVAGRHEALALDLIDDRLVVLSRWARGRLEAAPGLAAAIGATERFRSLLGLSGQAAFGRSELRRLCDHIESDLGAAGPAEAGLGAVGSPGGIVGPADTILWWGFTRDRAPSAPRLRLSVAERRALADAGVSAPDFGAVMEAESAAWNRPLSMARQSLILVCPQRDASGERSFAHPLWDELCARMSDPQDADRLETQNLTHPAPPITRTANRRAAIDIAERVRTSSSLSLREVESPSSLERLLGCSLSWGLTYRGRLRAGLSRGPVAPTPLIFGILAHHVLAKVFADAAPTPEAAAQSAQALLDADLPGLCESLSLPRYQVERSIVIRAVVDSARAIAQLVAEQGARIEGTELSRRAERAELVLSGKADLVLRDPDAVIDLKWGKISNRDRLAAGAALQLAAYAEIFAEAGKRPDVGYLILRTQELFVEAGASLPGVAPGAASAADTWRGAMTRLGERKQELSDGVLSAPGANGQAPKSILSGDRLEVAPPCVYCSFGVICGRSAGT